MKRAIFLVSILLSLPQVGWAQVPPLIGSRSHTVAPGETLGMIAQRYLGSASEWQRISEANRGQMTSPELITPGMVLIIPGEAAATVANVVGFQAGGVAFTSMGSTSFESRRDLLGYRTFGTSGIPEVPLEARTVFYDEASVNAVSAVIVPTRDEAPALPESFFHAASWLIAEHDSSYRLGEIIGLAISGSRASSAMTLLPGDEVRIRLGGEVTSEVGEEFLVYAVRRTLDDIGAVAVPTGKVRVTGSMEGEATAIVVTMYDSMKIGDLLARVRTFPLVEGVHPIPTTTGTEAQVLAFGSLKEVYLPGDQAFLDRGSEAGVALGDELVAVVGEESARQVGATRFQVVGVREGGATVRLLTVGDGMPLRPGLLLVTDRKMP